MARQTKKQKLHKVVRRESAQETKASRQTQDSLYFKQDVLKSSIIIASIITLEIIIYFGTMKYRLF